MVLIPTEMEAPTPTMNGLSNIDELSTKQMSIADNHTSTIKL